MEAVLTDENYRLAMEAVKRNHGAAGLRDWIEKHLRPEVNQAKSGTGRVWERRFPGFRPDRNGRIGIAPESPERFRTKVREMWSGRRSRTSEELRDERSRYVRGWWGYFRLAGVQGTAEKSASAGADRCGFGSRDESSRRLGGLPSRNYTGL